MTLPGCVLPLSSLSCSSLAFQLHSEAKRLDSIQLQACNYCTSRSSRNQAQDVSHIWRNHYLFPYVPHALYHVTSAITYMYYNVYIHVYIPPGCNDVVGENICYAWIGEVIMRSPYFWIFQRLFGKVRFRGGRSLNPTIENFIAAFKGCALYSIIHTNPRTNQESFNDSLPFCGSFVIKLLKDNHKELETDNSAPEDQYFFPEEYFDEDEDMVPVDELPDIDDLDRQIVYHLTGFSTFRKKLNGQLCAHCQEIFFLNKVMREFFIPLDSQLTQSRDRGGLEYVGTAVHHFFCDLEKVLRHFFQTNDVWNNSRRLPRSTKLEFVIS